MLEWMLEMKRGTLPKLTDWAKGKALDLVVIAAQQSAVSAEPLFKWLKSLEVEEVLGDRITPPTLREWLNLNKEHRHLEERLIEIFKGLGGIAEYGTNLVESIKAVPPKLVSQAGNFVAH